MREYDPNKEGERRWGVIFLVYDRRVGKVLLERREDLAKSYYGKVIIPGGKVKPGETFGEALDRELWEEFEIAREQMVDLGEFENVTLSEHFYLMHAYLITKYGGEVVNKENQSIHLWVTSHEASMLLREASSLLVLEKARPFISKQAG